MIARRVLNALHIPVKRLHIVERNIFQDPQFDTALWPRAKRVLEHALRIERNDLFRCWRIEAAESDRTHKEILDKYEMALMNRENVRPVFLTRFWGTTSSYTYSSWLASDPISLTPPFSVIAAIGKWRIILQETTAFLEQFGLAIVFEEALKDEES